MDDLVGNLTRGNIRGVGIFELGCRVGASLEVRPGNDEPSRALSHP